MFLCRTWIISHVLKTFNCLLRKFPPKEGSGSANDELRGDGHQAIPRNLTHSAQG